MIKILSKFKILKMKFIGLLASRLISKISLIKFKFLLFTSLGLSNIIPAIEKMMVGFLNTIMTGIGNLFSTTFASLGSAIAIMFQSFGFSTAQYGILGPTAFVGGLGVAFLVGYLMLVPGDAEKDVVQAEDEV